MWRNGSKLRRGAVSGKDTLQPQQLVAVAVDSNKNSQHALKWAADHAIAGGQMFLLIHVRKIVPTPNDGQELATSEVEDEAAMSLRDYQTRELLLPFQCFCTRRRLNCKEVILDDTNIPKAIVDYVEEQGVEKLVLGASSGNAFTRAFKSTDIPASVSKFSPEFCSVYVISKGRISSARPATRPPRNHHQTNELPSSVDTAGNQFQSAKSETVATNHIVESPRRFAMVNNARVGSNHSTLHEWDIDQSEEVNPYQSVASCPSPSRLSIDQQRHYLTVDRPTNYRPQILHNRGNEQYNLSVSTDSDHSYLNDSEYDDSDGVSRSKGYLHSAEEMESELRRLKLELKSAEDKYDEVCDMKAAEEPVSKEEWFSGEGKIVSQKLPDSFSSHARYRRYTIEEIEEATNNFSDAMIIGEGGYGPVFKCTLDHTPVAVKIPRTDVAQGMKQFQQEVEVLSSIRHPNLVLLMGACPEYGCLVYEYMRNGSLEDRLFCRSGTPPLTWQLRFKIAAEIATGLLFLHHNNPEPIVHRDLKPANILLDENFVSRVTDVGLARLIPSATSSYSTRYVATVAAGTFCYIDPEYQKSGTVGVKSDTYALGIILMQIITGKQPMGLTRNIENAIEKGRLKDMLDPNVQDWPVEETEKLARLALACSELRRRDRPDLASIVLPELNRLRALAESTLDS